MIAAILQGPIGRLFPVGFVLLAVQTTVLSEIRPAGVVIQLLAAFAAAAGVAGGPERGMLAGFVVGVMFDLGTGGPIGASALTMGIAGMVGGTVAFLNIEIRRWMAALFVGLGAAIGEAAVPVVRLFIGQTEVTPAHWFIVVPVVAVTAAAMSPLLVPLARWCLRVDERWKVPAL